MVSAFVSTEDRNYAVLSMINDLNQVSLAGLCWCCWQDHIHIIVVGDRVVGGGELCAPSCGGGGAFERFRGAGHALRLVRRLGRQDKRAGMTNRY
jgi:hypothetical protein